MLGEPAFRGVTLTVLLFSPIPGHDELQGQRQYLWMAGCGDAGIKERMEILVAAIIVSTYRTVRAMDFAGGEIFSPVPRDQTPAIKAFERIEVSSKPRSAPRREIRGQTPARRTRISGVQPGEIVRRVKKSDEIGGVWYI